MFAELGQNWTVGSEAIWEEFSHTRTYAVRSGKAPFLRKTGWKSSDSGFLLSAYAFLLPTIFSFFSTTKQ